MIYAFLNASMFALLLQNLVFNGGFGMSEAIRIATKPRDFFPIALLVAFSQAQLRQPVPHLMPFPQSTL